MANGEPTLADDLLPDCTVRVDVGGRAAGTGFFAAPGFVVTCAHVIESRQLSSGEADTEIETVHRETPHAVDVIAVSAEDDLAILKLRTQYDHPCVLLDAGLLARDELHTFGYPRKYPNGVPTTLEAEGETGGDRPWVKVKEGQVQPGMSGAPVLNIRTASVCGVLKRTRDERQPLGGYAIPVTAVFQLDPTLQASNERFHQKDRRWLDLLPPARRRALEKSLGAKPAEGTAATQFIVNLGQTASGWEVRAHVHPGNEPIGPVAVDLNTVRREVARLFRDWASRGRVPEAQQIRLLGSILYRAAFPREIGKRLESLVDTQDRERVLVALGFDEGTDPDLIQLPWEHLYVPREGRTGVQLAIEPSLSFARSLLPEPREDEPPGQTTLSVLVIAVKPRQFEDAPASWPGAASLIDEAVSGLTAAANRVNEQLTLLEMRDIESPDPFKVEEEVAGVDVVHYVGFGRFSEGADQLALGANTTTGIDFFSIDVLADSLRGGKPRLVVLQLCEGPPNTVPADFAVLAPTLLDRIPAVVAYQYPVAPKIAAKFNMTLYEELAAGAAVDMAVQDARNKLRLDGRAFVSPALFVREPGELRLTVPTHAPMLQRTGVSASRG